MAGNTGLYTLIYCTVSGALLTQEASVTITRNTNSQAVNTVAIGYAGESPGAANVEIDIDNAVPSADFELDPGPYMKALQPVEIGLVHANGKRLTAKGFIISDTLKHAVNSETQLSFKFRGTMVQWQA